MNERLTITDVAKSLNVTPRTIMRWEKTGKIKKSKRDWRRWRFYLQEDLEEIRNFYEGTYENEGNINTGSFLRDTMVIFFVVIGLSLGFSIPLCAAGNNFAASKGIRETAQSVDIVLDELPAVNVSNNVVSEDLKYTLGTNDVISIEVRRHPEFNGKYQVNSEGKIGYKYVGDIVVSGLTKKEVTARIADVLSKFIIKPQVDVQIVSYLSKVIYVVGDVGRPGKFYMKGDTILVREALIQAGLPTQAASLRNCRLITPGQKEKGNYRKVDAYRLLYEGDLKENLVMNPGDVLYVPATLIAKMIRVVSPVTTLVGDTAGAVGPAAAMAL